jgi:tRNA-Thr(GGU) m(6)t(6)A37 methyltransferase TsaA
MTISFEPIGLIRTPFTEAGGMPIQPKGAENITATVEVFAPFREGLADLDGFTHIYLIYHFHQSHGYRLKVVPFMDNVERGLFSTRAPKRPNPVGLSVVRLEKIEQGILHVRGADVLDKTPLLDIKPYAPTFDSPEEEVRTGWLERSRHHVASSTSDERFS